MQYTTMARMFVALGVLGALASGCSSGGGGGTCDPSTGACTDGSTPTGCVGTSRSTCSYGAHCVSTACTAAPVATSASCDNFAVNAPSFNPATNNGPVIYEVSNVAYQAGSSYCTGGAPDAFIVRVKAYRTDADWPVTRSGVSGFFYRTTSGQDIDIVNSGLLVPNVGYTRGTDPRDAEFQVYVCAPASTPSRSLGFFFTGGNPVCFTATP